MDKNNKHTAVVAALSSKYFIFVIFVMLKQYPSWKVFVKKKSTTYNSQWFDWFANVTWHWIVTILRPFAVEDVCFFPLIEEVSTVFKPNAVEILECTLTYNKIHRQRRRLGDHNTSLIGLNLLFEKKATPLITKYYPTKVFPKVAFKTTQWSPFASQLLNQTKEWCVVQN